MKIRSQLVLLIGAALAPIALFAGIATERLWALQRESYEQRYLERVRALRLALDTEIEATLRNLRALAEVPGLETPERLAAFVERFPRLLVNNPGWAEIGLVTPAGAPLAHLARDPAQPAFSLDAATREQVVAGAVPVISNVVAIDHPRNFLTYIAVPVQRGGALRAVLYVAVDHRSWLAFLQRYPIAESATLTLNDRHGRIIARTLNNDEWAGRPSSPAYWQRTVGEQEGAFASRGLEGQRFYSAFSRLRTSSWVLGTGVPQEEVEVALRGPTLMLVAGVLAAALIAGALALLVGRRIAGALTRLAATAKAVGAAGRPATETPLPIDEAETVRSTLLEASSLLRARESSLNESLAREMRSRAEAERASQAKDEFLAMLGHELRNPLSTIKTAVTVLDLAGDQADVADRARASVHRQVRHLTAIVDELLDVARLNSGKITLSTRPLDLAEVTRHVVDSLRDAGRCAHLAIGTDLAAAAVFGDETRLEQVVSNLLDNACKYTPPGGRVEVAVRADGAHATLTVRDSGVGIAAEMLPYVFELFAQGSPTPDRAHGGLGLGLTVVRRLVELHGGTVAASSDGAGRGSTFVVRLPRLTTGAVAAAAPAPGLALEPMRIAVVEDGEDNRDVMAALLRMKGHHVTVAADGPSGLDAILDGPVDLAVVDVGLPGFDGMELARRVRASATGRKVRLIALTGYGSDQDRAGAVAAGFDAFLVKPFDVAKFEATVQATGSADGTGPASLRE